MAKLCPSAQAGMDNCRILGVVQKEGPTPMLAYLNQPLPATLDVLAMAAPLKPYRGVPARGHLRRAQVPAFRRR